MSEALDKFDGVEINPTSFVVKGIDELNNLTDFEITVSSPKGKSFCIDEFVIRKIDEVVELSLTVDGIQIVLKGRTEAKK